MSPITPPAVCFTGHRPEKIPFDTDTKLFLDMLCSVIYMHACDAVRDGCKTFYCGMQRGVDIWSGKQVLRLKRVYPDIRLICVSPYESEIRSRHGRDLIDYEELKGACDEFVALHKSYEKGCFFERNRYMVDRSGFVIGAVADFKSGTAQTLAYAKRLGRTVHTIDLRRFAEDYGIPLKE